MTHEEPRVPLVSHNLTQVFKLKRDITEALEQTYLDCTLHSDDLHEVVAIVHAALPTQVQEGCVFESLRHLAGVKLDRQLLRMEAWRIAGNVRLLKQGYTVAPWRVQRFNEWVPLQVIDCKPTRSPKQKKIGSLMTFRVLAGTPCTLTFDAFWTQRFCRYFASYAGFSAPWKETPFSRMEEYVRLRTYGLLAAADPPGSDGFDGRSLRVEQYLANSSCLSYNKDIIRKRARIGFKCPQNYRHACHQCAFGFDRCPAGTHPRTYEKHECDDCGQLTWFDPMWVALGICVGCQRKRDLTIKEGSND